MVIDVVHNHYGYGLHKDEVPFAHKIPPGGNWRSLSREDQLAFWKGRIPTDGGNSLALNRRAWDQPALTITATPNQKLSCQLHPGAREEMRPYQPYDVTPQQPANGFTVVELFCGGGLMAVGLKQAGYNIIWANDLDKRAVRAYQYNNLGNHVVLADITTIDPDDIPDADIIAGGPPCQDYSVAGTHQGEQGERGKLVWTYLNIIEKKQPKAFIFENVKGLITKRHIKTFEALLQKFDEIGYTVSWQVINAWDYGVAQKRERVFIVGIRKDLGFKYKFPDPKPEDYRTQVLRDVIGDLPEPVANHDPKPLSDQALDYLTRDPRHLKKHRPPTMDEPSSTLPAVLHKGVPYGLFYPNHDAYWTPPSEYTYDQANRVQSMDKPCATIPAHHNSGQPIHPTRAPRRFTVRECLRIQSVPDWYVLPEDLSLSAMYRIVGNGVPCKVSWYLGIALAEQLKEHLGNEKAR